MPLKKKDTFKLEEEVITVDAFNFKKCCPYHIAVGGFLCKKLHLDKLYTTRQVENKCSTGGEQMS